jgi:signal transduction histidine kinase
MRLQTGTLWLKLGRTAPAGQALYLHFVQPNVDLVTVYGADAASAAVPGSAQTLSAKELQGGKLLLPPGSGGVPETYYLQIRIKGLHWVTAELLTGDERAARLHLEWMVLSAQLTFVLLACVGALFQWLQTRRVIYLGLLGVNTVFLLYRLNLQGMLIDVLGLDAQSFVALSTALMVSGLVCLVLVLRWMFPPLASHQADDGRMPTQAGALLVLLALVFYPERRLVILAALLLTSMVIAEITYRRYQAWRMRPTKAADRSDEFITVLPYALLIGCNVAVFLGLFPSTFLKLSVSDMRQFNYPLLCTVMFLTLVRRHHTEAALQGAALLATGESLRAEVARRVTQQHFMAMLVHEIRGPLTVIGLGNRALTQRVLDTAQTAAWAQRMHSATDTIGQIVENCDEIDRLEAGALAVAADEVAIAPVLSDTLDRLRHTVPGAAERIQTVYALEALRYASCRGDAHFLGTILRNLLANALKYAPAGSAVQLHCSAVQQGGRACVEFAVHNDQGTSGAPDPARVFERYYRAPSATQIAGTGLGLWLSQNLARQMHSEIRLALAGPKIVFSFAMEQVAH